MLYLNFKKKLLLLLLLLLLLFKYLRVRVYVTGLSMSLQTPGIPLRKKNTQLYRKVIYNELKINI